jgi:hypothetical protein
MDQDTRALPDFGKILTEQVQKVADDKHWRMDDNAQRGYAFQLWFAGLLCQYDQGLDTDPEKAMLYAKDLGADLVLEDQTRQHLYIIQCKYLGSHKKNKPIIDDQQLESFFRRHEKFMDREWVRKNGSSQAFEALGDYREHVDAGWSIHFYFVSSGRMPDKASDWAEAITKEYCSKGFENIRCELYDFQRLKDFYVQAQSLEHGVPPSVSLDLPEGLFFEKLRPRRTLVCVLKGNSLKNLYGKYKESLFAWNIRGYLGNRGINREITTTAEKEAEDFFYFNNGVSAVCTHYDLNGNTVVATNFQVINGAQTVGALARGGTTMTEVLFRLTVTDNVSTGSGINQRIIRYNNTQNAIKLSDFRANDPIQVWLEKRFAEIKNMPSLPAVHYAPKRSNRKHIGHRLSLEDLARIRYSFRHEPMTAHASVKDLWTPAADGGLYEKAFGNGTKVPPLWTDEEFEDCLLAVALYLKIEDACRDERRKGKPYLRRLRFHALALLRIFLESRGLQAKAKMLLKNPDKFDAFWRDGWLCVRSQMNVVYNFFVNPETADRKVQSTMHSFVRNPERWKMMRTNVANEVGNENHAQQDERD